MQGKKTVPIFVQKDKRATKILLDFISKNIDELNKYLFLEITFVTKQNAAKIKNMGINRTPTLIYKNKKYTDVEKIIKLLTPPTRQQETYGLSNYNPDELIYEFQKGVIASSGEDNDNNEEEDDDVPGSNRADELRRKMAAMQKRRPQMEGVDKDKYLKGGRRVVSKDIKKSFNSDSEFRKTAGIDDMEITPIKGYSEEPDGDTILENYRNAEADSYGRKINTKPIRWSS